MKLTRAALPVAVREKNENIIADIINIEQWTRCHMVILLVNLPFAVDSRKYGWYDNKSVQIG